MLKDLQKTFKAHHVLLLLGGLVLIYVIYNYSSNKGLYPENYESQNKRSSNPPSNMSPPSNGKNPTGANDGTFYVDYAPVNSNDGNMAGMPANCSSQNTNNPSDLLLAGLRIHPHHAVRVHGGRPDLAVLVDLRPIGIRVRR